MSHFTENTLEAPQVLPQWSQTLYSRATFSQIRSVDLPWFGGHVAAVLRGWALTHHCGHVNVKVFGDILYVGLSEAHST